MKVEETESLIKNWKHWLVYSTCTFLTIFVIVEFVLSVSLFAMIAPSTFMFYFTPVGLVLGETIVSLFASVLLFVCLFIVLRFKVYVKNENSLKFNRSKAYLLLPLYLTAIISLAIYISYIPLELSNLVTYVVFIILFESFIEHTQVSHYGEWIKGIIEKEPSKLKEKKVIEPKKEGVQEEKISQTTKAPTIELKKEPVKDLLKEEPPIKPVKVKKKVKKVKKPVKKKHVTCPVCGNKEEKEARICSECGESLVEEESKYPSSEIFQELEKRLKDFEAESEEPYEEIMEETEIEKPSELDESIMNELDEELKSLEEETEEPIECPVCGAEFSRLEESCPECGEPVDSEEFIELIDCPICGAIFNHLEERCPECGEPVEEEDEEEDIFSELV